MTLIAERLAQQYPDTNKEIGAAVVPLRDHWTGDVRFSLLLLLAGCGGVLLIACANVSQLLLARATTRERELAVRAALGASRWRLARQVLTESALLALLGSVAGAVLAFWLVDLVAASIPIELPFWIRIDVDPNVLVFAVIVSCVTALLAGFLPAWQSTRVGISQSLKAAGAGNTGGTGVGARSREILTIAQVAASIVLLVGASLVLRSMLKLKEVNPGFDARNVLMMEVNPTYSGDEPTQKRIDRFSRLLQRLSEMPGVEAVAANNSPPFVPQRPWNRTQLTAEHQSPDEQSRNPLANFQTVSSDYFRTLRIPLLRGRVFDERDKLDALRVCMISEGLAKRLWPAEDAIGKRVKLGNSQSGLNPDWLVIVGVVADVRHQSLNGEAGPDFYMPSLQLAWKQMHFLVRARNMWGSDVLSLVPSMRREIAATAPEVGVFNFVSLGEEVAEFPLATASARMAARLFLHRRALAGGGGIVRRGRLWRGATDARDRNSHGAGRHARLRSASRARAGNARGRDRSRRRDRRRSHRVARAERLALRRQRQRSHQLWRRVFVARRHRRHRQL